MGPSGKPIHPALRNIPGAVQVTRERHGREERTGNPNEYGYDQIRILKSLPKCGRKTRSGRQCGQPAGFGTFHLGEGACCYHGGMNMGAGHLTHGGHSKTAWAIAMAKAPVETCEVVEDMLQGTGALIDFMKDTLERLAESQDGQLKLETIKGASEALNRIENIRAKALETRQRQVVVDIQAKKEERESNAPTLLMDYVAMIANEPQRADVIDAEVTEK